MSATAPMDDRDLLLRLSEQHGLHWKEMDALSFLIEKLARNPLSRISSGDRFWLQRLARKHGLLANGTTDSAEASDPTVYVPRHGQPIR